VYLVIAALALALLLALAFYRNYRNTKKANRIIAQQQQETEEKKRIIEISLTEKETLLKEIHHRVKNNLQIISSLLNLQANRTDDENLKRIMNEAKNRISSMALIHQKIYQSGNLSSVDFQAYIEQMAQSIDANFNNEKKNITQHINTHGISLDIDTSIPLGLIINELLTNSYKYAFAGRSSGTIRIILKEKNAGELELHVSDDGKGLPAGFDPATLNSLGVKLVKGLASQVKGTVRFESNQGTHCFIDFKKPQV
jgi:two-component sensor histidine kinase